MADIDAWAGNAFPLAAWSDDIDPAVDAARIISDRSVSITVKRGAATLAAQTVRVEDLSSRGRSYQTEAGQVGQADVLVIGYRGHPTIANTNLQRGDRFVLSGVGYEVVMVVPALANQLQAFARIRA